MLSKFAYVPYDQQASKEQNELRKAFKELETRILNGENVSFGDIPKPPDAYFCITKSIEPLWTQRPWDRLKFLETLYFLAGRTIWEEAAERAKKSLAEF